MLILRLHQAWPAFYTQGANQAEGKGKETGDDPDLHREHQTEVTSLVTQE